MLVHGTGILLLLTALGRVNCAMALYREESDFLKQWVLSNNIEGRWTNAERRNGRATSSEVAS